MWPLSTAAQNALVGNHTMSLRATATTPSLGSVSDIPIAGGTITVSATSQTRRTGEIYVADAAFWPATADAILSPLGSELLVEYGITIPGGGTEWVPLIQGVITDVSRTRPVSSSQAAFTVSLSDRSERVVQARFDQPTQTLAGATVVAEIRRLITEALPTATVLDRTGSTLVASQLDMQRERWADGIEKLADAIAAEVFADPIGQFIIRPQPTLNDTSVWLSTTGDGGILVSLDEKPTRDLTFNRIVASGQRTDGTPPVWAVVSDSDPTSPTYTGGPFGTKTRFYVSPLLTTTGQCTTAAQGLLARTTGMHGTVTLSIITNPALDAGDVITVVDNGITSTHIIDTVTIPLSPKEAQHITTRSLDLPPEA